MNPELKCGDMFLEYSNRKIAKLVMFLMQEPTIWSWLYHKIFGGMNEVNFYHAGMILSPTISIEQQKVVDSGMIIFVTISISRKTGNSIIKVTNQSIRSETL